VWRPTWSEPHPSYSYELESEIDGNGYRAYVIRMISQEWLTADEVDQPEWWHWLTIVVPDDVNHSTALLRIGGGTSGDDHPDSVNPMVRDAALSTGSVTADLHNVPNQPLSFSNDERMEERYEDDIIALGWRTFLEGGARNEDAVWLSRLPMTAAAMRAMDTITEFASEKLDLGVNEYVVTGESKRGWTAWTTAIFDDRVAGVAPVVIDLLNMEPSFEHHWQAYGEWSSAISEYEDEGIMNWKGSQEYQRLRELVDPYSYLDRLNLPKMIINAASDEFFLPDSWQFYWEDLPGEKAIRYIPNSGHSVSETDAAETITAFYHSVLNNHPLPRFDWSADEDGFEIRLDPDNLPDRLILWDAYNPQGRDFRLYVIDRIWLARNIQIPDDGIVRIDIQTPDRGYTARFVEAAFQTDNGLPLKLTTGVQITPDHYPFEPFENDRPMGTPLSSDSEL
jgi:PhoPQ-activated pathogenicity-related protein